jgi:hypothetical protein
MSVQNPTLPEIDELLRRALDPAKVADANAAAEAFMRGLLRNHDPVRAEQTVFVWSQRT